MNVFVQLIMTQLLMGTVFYRVKKCSLIEPMFVGENDCVTLTCEIKGNTVTWHGPPNYTVYSIGHEFADKLKNRDRLALFTNNTLSDINLRIRNFSKDDVGDYKCTSHGSEHVVDKFFNLQLHRIKDILAETTEWYLNTSTFDPKNATKPTFFILITLIVILVVIIACGSTIIGAKSVFRKRKSCTSSPVVLPEPHYEEIDSELYTPSDNSAIQNADLEVAFIPQILNNHRQNDQPESQICLSKDFEMRPTHLLDPTAVTESPYLTPCR